MGWFGDLIKKVSGGDSKDFILIDTLPPIVPVGTQATTITPDECYISIYVESLRIERARKFTSTFHGAVYLFASLARRGDRAAAFAAVSKPDKIAELDGASLGKVITVSRQMMGAVPWRGGNLHIELGLFSIKSGNLLSPVLDYVRDISKTAGIAFLGSVEPFVPLITQGMAMISGQTGDTLLEVGADTSIALDSPVTCAIIAAEKGSIERGRLAVDPFDRKLLYDGKPLERSYCVFSIRSTDRKPDYGEIPELKESFNTFSAAVLKGRQPDAEQALADFRREAIVSPDLITSDAKKLVEMAEQMMRDSFGAGAAKGTARGTGFFKVKLAPQLSELKLYDTEDAPYTAVEIFYATDRDETGDSDDPYGPGRSPGGEIHYGRCIVTVPDSHRKGRLEAPSWLKLEFRADPARHILLQKTLPKELDAYLTEVAARVAASPLREAFVFVHGFNVAFADAARRTAQMAFDLEFAGAPILYSWPSMGRTLAYAADEASAIWTVPHLETFLNLLAERSGAKRIHIIAHSMGNRAVCDALNLIAAGSQAGDPPKFHHLVLTAPDVDADSFRQMAASICSTASTVTLYVSSNDKALRVSAGLHKQPRAGQPVLILPGVETIDASEVDTDFLAHSYYGDARSILSDIFHLLHDDKPAAQRTFDLKPVGDVACSYYAVVP